MSKEPVKSNNEHASARQRAQSISEEERLEIDRRQRTDPEFIEHTRPEDPSPRPGQLTRDNVNPNIPSGKRGDVPNAGGIVDPSTLGMEGVGGGKAPNFPPSREELRKQREEGTDPQNLAVSKEGEVEGSKYSINEPPGSDVYEHVPGLDNELPPPTEPPLGGKPPEPPLGGSARAAKGPETGDDPDDIEDEIDQMKEEGDVEVRGKPAPKKK